MNIKTIVLILPFMITGCNYKYQQQNASDSLDATKSKVQPQGGNIIDPTRSIFPMDRYSQNIEKWIPSTLPSSNLPVIDSESQVRHFSQLKSHYFGTGANDSSPWGDNYIRKITTTDLAQTIINNSINTWLSSTTKAYGINFKSLPLTWKNEVKANATVTVPDASAGRAITVRETLVRMLPTIDPAFNDPREAGEGYPFDNLQVSAIRPGTPLYVLTSSKDKAWKYIASPTVMGWVKSDDIAKVDHDFVSTWVSLAETQLGAFIKEPVSVTDGNTFYFTARPGTILPFRQQQANRYLVAIPVKQPDGSAQIKWFSSQKEDFMAMPLKMTPNNIAYLMQSMQGKPYGWGNFNFYNDCSAELRSLMMPFGIFLPRNSAAQAANGRVVDLSKEDVNTRINYLAEHGKPFSTLVHITGHIMLYLGNTTLDGKTVPMTYQNLWGLHTQQTPGRSIIGGSVFFPLLATYPENSDLSSPADKPLFALSFIE